MSWRGSQAESRDRYLFKYDAEEVERYESWILQLTRDDDEACLSDIARAFQFREGMAVLDVGAGTGAMCRILSHVPGLLVTALEPSGAMLAKLRAKTELHHVEHLHATNSPESCKDRSVQFKPCIRLMEAADIPAVVTVLRESAGMYILKEFSDAGRESFLSKNDEVAIAQFMSDGFRYHIAELDHKLIGFVGVRGNSHLYHLFVDAGYHRHGLGRMLWEVAKAECLRHGNLGVFTVNSSNNAVSIYERFGFRRTAPMQDNCGVLFNPMEMRLDQ